MNPARVPQTPYSFTVDAVMERRTFLAIASGSLLTMPLAAEAQQAAKVYRIGELREGRAPFSYALADALRGLGLVEGQNLKFERRYADRGDQHPALAIELVRLKVDLIVTGGTPAAKAAKAATKTIPIVFSVGSDPVESGLVASFSRPGGNLTGVAIGLYDEKLLEVLREALPRVSRVAHPVMAASERLARLTAAARVLGVELQSIAVQGPADLEPFFAAARRAGAGAALVPDIAWFSPHLDRIGAAAAKSRLPAIGYDRPFAKSGGLLSYGPARLQDAPRMAAQIEKILIKGAHPADLPVEQPTTFELVINLKTAKALGLTIPPSLLQRADQVIE
jgi:putative tryptophan/tyrosine transport system substrate-binding protein